MKRMIDIIQKHCHTVPNHVRIPEGIEFVTIYPNTETLIYTSANADKPFREATFSFKTPCRYTTEPITPPAPENKTDQAVEKLLRTWASNQERRDRLRQILNEITNFPRLCPNAKTTGEDCDSDCVHCFGAGWVR